MNILLIDQRVGQYEAIVAAIDPVLAIGITFDYYTDTFETIKARIAETLQMRAAASGAENAGSVVIAASSPSSISVGLIQHNYNAPAFSMLASGSGSCIVARVETQDPTLETWGQFKEFIVWCKTAPEIGAAHFDMMACALYSDPDWKYIVDTLATQTGATVRASTDNTGSAALGGNWFLESHTGVNLKDTYFTELIEEYRGVLSGTGTHSFFITNSGTVYACGDNSLGQLGLGDTTNRSSPTLISSLTNIVAVSNGIDYSLFLTSMGTVYACGLNNVGQLGLGDAGTNRSSPTLISSLTNIVAVSNGWYHSLFLTSAGAVYACGFNNDGRLGLGDNTNRSSPTLISSLTNIVAISCGAYHSLFIKSDGAVYACGANGNGQLGLGANDNTDRSSPTLIPSLTNIVAVSCGAFHSLFLTSAGAVYACGANGHGQLGLGDNTNRSSPTLISSLTNIVAISCGIYHSFFITNSGTVYTCGYNGYGQLGLGNAGDSTGRNSPTIISSLPNIVAISCGIYHSLFLTSAGAVYACGYNNEGQLGLGDAGVNTARSSPTLVSGTYKALTTMPAKYVSVGWGTTNSIAYSYDGITWAGLGKSIFSSWGAGVAYSAQLNRWVAVGGYYANSIAYSTDGITWTGIGSSIFSTNGKGVAYSAQLSRWVAVGQGTQHTIAYSTDGITWTGLGMSIFSTTGHSVAYSAELSRWVAVGEGTHTVAYSTDGITWTGLSTSVFSSYGYGVAYSAQLSRWVAVGQGTHTIAYSTDGITWTGLGVDIFVLGFGVAYSAQLNRWVAVGTGTQHTIAYSTDGITWTGLGMSIFSTNGHSVAYSAQLSRWVAVGNGTYTIAYSTDGITWTGLSTSLFSSWGAGVAAETIVSLLAEPTLSSFAVPSSKTMVDAPFSITTAPSSASDGAITYTSLSTGVATIDASTGVITLVSAGDVIFRATQAATSTYASATVDSNTLTVALATSAFSSATFTVPSSGTYGTGTLSITTAPSSASDGAITYTSLSTGVATINASTGVITLVSAGDVIFRASQAATSTYASATVDSNTLTVALGTSAFSSATFTVASTKTNVDAPFSITTAPSSASAGAITYVSSNTAVATINASSGVITPVSAGDAIFTATQAATSTYASATVDSNTLTVSIVTSLAGQTLAGNLAGKDFTGTSFAGATVQSGVSLAGCTLTGANFAGATLAGVNFSGATITGVNFTNANIVGATNLPEFSTAQKLQLMRNAVNAAIGEVQFSTRLTGADINSAITTPVPAIAGASFVIKAPSYNGSNEKVVTVISADVSGNASIYIPLNDNETVAINGVEYTFDGTNVLDATGRVVRFLTILDVPYRLYAGSIIGLNVAETLNSIKFAGTGLYDLLLDLCVFKN